MGKNMIEIFVSYYKEYFVYENLIFKPYFVGNKLKPNVLGMRGDDSGENISEKNETYNEITLLYWAWKNTSQNYIGFAHYRRYLVYPENNNFFSKIGRKLFKNIIKNESKEKKINKILNDFSDKIEKDVEKYDIILPKPIYMPKTLREHYKEFHIVKHYDETGNIIREKFPEIYKNFVQASGKNTIFIANMFVLKREIFEKYCDFLFTILFELEKRIEVPTENQQKRVFGFISERLFTIYIDYLTEKFDYRTKFLDMMNLDSMFGIYKSYKIEKKVMCYKNNLTQGYIDGLTSLENDHYILNGWGIVDGIESSKYEKYIELYNSETSIIFKTDKTYRNDITYALAQKEKKYINYDDCGLNLIMKNEDFSSGRYKIKIIFELLDKSNQFIFYIPDSYIEVSDNKKVILKRVV